MSDFPTTVPSFMTLVDQQDDVLAAHQNVPNDEISAIATMLGAMGKSQSWGVDFISAMLNGTPSRCVKKDANTITVKAGVCWVGNSGQTIRLPRRNTSDVDITASDITTGSMAVGYYYIYAVADSVGTTCTYKFDTSASSPTGLTNYELIGWFYNETNSILDVTSGFVGNVKRGLRTAVPNFVEALGTDDILYTTPTTSYADMANMSLRFYTTGRPMIISFDAGWHTGGAASRCTIAIDVDGVAVREQLFYVLADDNYWRPIVYKGALAAGTHTIKIKWKTTDNRELQQEGSTEGPRSLSALEL